MFIKWRIVEGKGWKSGRSFPRFSYYAYLVKSYRNKEGKTMQKKIKYLGKILQYPKEKDIFPALVHFWDKVYQELKGLSLSKKDYKTAISSLSKKIPFLNEEEIPLKLEESRLRLNRHLERIAFLMNARSSA